MTPPNDGLAKNADNLTVKPFDRRLSWSTSGLTLASKLPLRLRVDCYNGPKGKGYIVVGELVSDGVTWQRAVNVGPERWREQTWRQAGEVLLATSTAAKVG